MKPVNHTYNQTMFKTEQSTTSVEIFIEVTPKLSTKSLQEEVNMHSNKSRGKKE